MNAHSLSLVWRASDVFSSFDLFFSNPHPRDPRGRTAMPLAALRRNSAWSHSLRERKREREKERERERAREREKSTPLVLLTDHCNS